MKRVFVPLAIVLAFGIGALVVIHCGDGATRGECDIDSDCPEGQACIDGVCVGPEVCDPPCDPEVEFCFGGECVPIGNPSDKDGDGYLTNDDCDDLDWAINPGATEYCDGVDNNCDTNVDEGCHPCADGDTQHCGTDVGECIAGTQTCQDGQWGPCEGSTGPEAERCDGKDNDCDGEIDEVCPCVDGETLPCGTDEGECSEGTELCENGAWSGCRNGDLPVPEACDGLDNDCDGITDDGFMVGEPCTGAGECGEGVIECAPDTETRCSTDPGGSQDASVAEACDGRDNDCDGSTDEDFELGQACTGTGACGPGTWECREDGTRICSTDPEGSQDQSQAELCDGIDNDCDGDTDEDYQLGEACEGVGACGAGETECASDSSTRCSTDPGGSEDQSQPELCDAEDNDCDGSTDEDFMAGGEVCGACGECDPATGGCMANDDICTGNCDYCRMVSDVEFVCDAVADGCGNCGSCTGSGNSFNCVANDTLCTGNCDVCGGSGTSFNCSGDDSLCLGNCDFCEGSGTEYNCAANDNMCTGNCDVCSGSGTVFNCAADDGMCTGNCDLCTGSGTSFTCTGDNGLCTGNCDYCSGSGTTFNCAAEDSMCTGNCDYCTGSGTSFSCAGDSNRCTGNCDQCSGSGTTFNCTGVDSLCTGNCDHCTGSGTSFNCVGDSGRCTGNCDYCSGSGTSFSCAPDNNLCSGNCDVCSGSGTSYSCSASASLCTGNCDVCTCSGGSCNCSASPSLCTGDCDVCTGGGTSFNCQGDQSLCPPPPCSGCGECYRCSGSGTSFSCTSLGCHIVAETFDCPGTEVEIAYRTVDRHCEKSSCIACPPCGCDVSGTNTWASIPPGLGGGCVYHSDWVPFYCPTHHCYPQPQVMCRP